MTVLYYRCCPCIADELLRQSLPGHSLSLSVSGFLTLAQEAHSSLHVAFTATRRPSQQLADYTLSFVALDFQRCCSVCLEPAFFSAPWQSLPLQINTISSVELRCIRYHGLVTLELKHVHRFSFSSFLVVSVCEEPSTFQAPNACLISAFPSDRKLLLILVSLAPRALLSTWLVFYKYRSTIPKSASRTENSSYHEYQ